MISIYNRYNLLKNVPIVRYIKYTNSYIPTSRITQFHTYSKLNDSKAPSESEIQLGKGIRVLREDFENFLKSGLSNTDIYHNQIVLIEPTHSNLTLRGKFYYLLFIKLARLSLKWYFTDLSVAATHFHVLEELRTVTVRWKLEGTSRPALIFPTSTHIDPSVYEGVFSYQFDEKGKIIVHKIDTIHPNPNFDKLLPKIAWWWWLRRSKPELSLSSTLPHK